MKSSGNILPAVLSVAGSDCGGGAGIQADMLAFAANGAYACTAIAALTAQNPDEVSGVEKISPAFLKSQLEAVCKYYAPAAAKTGMLFSAECIDCVADFFEERRQIRLVVDPVMISTSGAKLLSDDAVESMCRRLIPLSEVFTPNLDEACFLLGGVKIDRKNFLDCARRLAEKFSASVLLKGGHIAGDELVDVLVDRGGAEYTFESRRVSGVNTHGSGCTLSAAIAANMAKNFTLSQACRRAKEYMVRAIKNPIALSRDCFINHFPE